MNTQRGFTLLELMTAVALMGIVLTIGIPSFTTLMGNNRLTSQVNLFATTLQLARSEAVKNNLLVTVCPSVGGTSCATGTDFPNNDWSIGWITFIDRDRDGAVDGGNACGTSVAIGGDDCILNYVEGLSPDAMTLVGNTTDPYISYSGLGSSSEAATWYLCDDRRGTSGANEVPWHGSAANGGVRPSYARTISIANTGRVSTVAQAAVCDFN